MQQGRLPPIRLSVEASSAGLSQHYRGSRSRTRKRVAFKEVAPKGEKELLCIAASSIRLANDKPFTVSYKLGKHRLRVEALVNTSTIRRNYINKETI